MDNNNKIKQFVLKHKQIRDFYFMISGKSINRIKLDKQIVKKCKNINWFTKKEKIKDVVITLTSFDVRILDLKYTLYSLINQSIVPEKIIVWLAYDEIIPDFLDIYQKLFNIEIKFCKDIRSYKKLIPALRNYPKKYFVTADDDLYYPKNWLESLWESHKQNPNCIIASYVHEIRFDENCKPLPYKNWKMIVKKHKPSAMLFFCTGGGALYPPDSFPEETVNESVFTRLAPYADDIWFNVMSIQKGNKIAVSKRPLYKFKHVDVDKDYGLNEKPALLKINIFEDRNQEQLDNLLSYYSLSGNKLYNRIMEIEKGDK